MEADAPRVKVCGITSLADAEVAAALGAWAVGTIFYPRSPRRCDPDEAARISAALRRRVEICGVFVNASLDGVASIADAAGLTLLQLHGDEGPSYCAEAARRTGCQVIKARQVRSPADLLALRAFRTDFHMLDSSGRGLRGGTGETWDWEMARRRRGDIPFIVSGGLNPGNVAAAIAATDPWGVDTASGTEAEPGRKDPVVLEAFFAAVAGARSAAPAPAP